MFSWTIAGPARARPGRHSVRTNELSGDWPHGVQLLLFVGCIFLLTFGGRGHSRGRAGGGVAWAWASPAPSQQLALEEPVHCRRQTRFLLWESRKRPFSLHWPQMMGPERPPLLGRTKGSPAQLVGYMGNKAPHSPHAHRSSQECLSVPALVLCSLAASVACCLASSQERVSVSQGEKCGVLVPPGDRGKQGGA